MSRHHYTFSVRIWVVQIRGRYKGRVGRIVSRTYAPNDRYQVQFGAGGPFEWLSTKALRRATVDEIPEGVG